MTGKELRDKTDEAAKKRRYLDDQMHKANGGKSDYDELIRGYQLGALNGPPVEFLISILSRIKLDASLIECGQRDDIADLADEAIKVIRDARKL